MSEGTLSQTASVPRTCAFPHFPWFPTKRTILASPRLRSSFVSRALAGSSLRSLSLCDLPYETLRVSSAHVFSVADPLDRIMQKDTSLFLCARLVPTLRLRLEKRSPA